MAPRVGLELLHKLLIARLFLRIAAQLPPKAIPDIVGCGETVVRTRGTPFFRD